MRLWISVTQIVVRMLMGTSLLVLLLGCGNSRSASPSTGLFHIEVHPATCVFDPFSERFISSNLILTDTHPNNYDSSELQQLEAYINVHNDEEPPPVTLQWSRGGLKCASGLQITNISQNTVQIQSINMQVTSVPKVNARHYRLIDACSLLSASERVSCPGLFGGVPSLEYDYVLSKSSIGTFFPPQEKSDSIVLEPNDIANVSFYFSSVGTSANLIYNITPELMLNTGTMELKSATMELVFANKDQFSCVQLSKNTFVPEFPIPAVLSPRGDLTGHWCM